jgi:hypothetical protein
MTPIRNGRFKKMEWKFREYAVEFGIHHAMIKDMYEDLGSMRAVREKLENAK